MLQDILTAITVLGAALFVVSRFVRKPKAKSNIIPAEALLRKVHARKNRDD